VTEQRPAALSEQFFARDTVRVARDLLGAYVESRLGGMRTVGRIVEVEAYVGAHDPADHGFGNRRTARNAALFGPAGTAYVFRSYGMHWCLNAVTERAGRPTAVLLRALEPVEGLDIMAARRGTDRPHALCAGPGRLSQALGVTGMCNGKRLSRGALRMLSRDTRRPPRVIAGPRVGISKAVDWPLRFCIRDSPWLSRPA
jgi:DNA-3-methyladenine glycosylase